MSVQAVAEVTVDTMRIARAIGSDKFSRGCLAILGPVNLGIDGELDDDTDRPCLYEVEGRKVHCSARGRARGELPGWYGDVFMRHLARGEGIVGES